jgi:hypothetical protein
MSSRVRFGEPRAAHVGFYLPQACGHAFKHGRTDSLGGHGVQLGAVEPHLADDRRGGGRKTQPPDASIIGVDAARDQTMLFETVDRPRDRYRRDIGERREFDLLQVRALL